jgi:hypothetical protein
MLSLQFIQQMLGWALIIHYNLLVVWFVVFKYKHAWLYALHHRWFNISENTFDSLHYLLIGIYKILVLIFIAIPYLLLAWS